MTVEAHRVLDCVPRPMKGLVLLTLVALVEAAVFS